MKVELIDVTEQAERQATRVPGWRVQLTRQVWERYVVGPRAARGASEAGRLWDLLAFLWDGLRRAQLPANRLVAGFAFPVGFARSDLDAPTTARKRLPDTARLEAVAALAPDGAPCLSCSRWRTWTSASRTRRCCNPRPGHPPGPLSGGHQMAQAPLHGSAFPARVSPRRGRERRAWVRHAAAKRRRWAETSAMGFNGKEMKVLRRMGFCPSDKNGNRWLPLSERGWWKRFGRERDGVTAVLYVKKSMVGFEYRSTVSVADTAEGQAQWFDAAKMPRAGRAFRKATPAWKKLRRALEGGPARRLLRKLVTR